MAKATVASRKKKLNPIISHREEERVNTIHNFTLALGINTSKLFRKFAVQSEILV